MNTGVNVLLLTSKSWAGFNISPPLGLYNLKTSLEANGHHCDIYDYDIDDEEHIKNTYLDRADLIRFTKNRTVSGKKKKRIITFSVDSLLNSKGNSGIHLQKGDEIRIYSLSTTN